MKYVRVFYNTDGSVRIMGMFAPQEDTTQYDEGIQKIPDLQGLDYDDIACDDIPFIEFTEKDAVKRGKKIKIPVAIYDNTKRDKWRGSKGNGFQIDETVETGAEKRARKRAEVDEILDKPTATNAELKRVLKLMREGI